MTDNDKRDKYDDQACDLVSEWVYGGTNTIARLTRIVAAAIRKQGAEIERLTKDLETGFMAGAYARLQYLQEAERENSDLRAELAQLKAQNQQLWAALTPEKRKAAVRKVIA